MIIALVLLALSPVLAVFAFGGVMLCVISALGGLSGALMSVGASQINAVSKGHKRLALWRIRSGTRLVSVGCDMVSLQWFVTKWSCGVIDSIGDSIGVDTR